MGESRDLHLDLTADDAGLIFGGWRPIATAPKEGSVDLWVDDGAGGYRVTDGWWETDFHNAEPGWCESSGLRIEGRARPQDRVTHWMPLPGAPK